MKRSRNLPLRCAALFIAALCLVGCGASTYQMKSSTSVPASQGEVAIEETDSGNTKIAVRVKHLAPPAKVQGSASVYAVWVEPPGGEPQNVGTLELDDDLQGTLDTLTPHTTFLLTVTPEASPETAMPSGTPVLTYNHSRS